MPESTSPQAHRTIVCHKHPSSGRLSFIRFPSGNIVGPEPLPKLAVLHEQQNARVLVHPGVALRILGDALDIDPRYFSFCGDFRLFLEVPHQFAPDGLLPILLVAVAGYTLPVLPNGHAWMEMPDSLSLPWLEREMLRQAYEYLMG